MSTLEPQKFFNIISYSAIKRWGLISSFRDFSKLGVPLARREHQEKLFRFFLSDINLLKSIFPDFEESKHKPKEFLSGLLMAVTKRSEEQFHVAVDAASLIFAHSIIDSCAYNYCRLSASIDPNSWEEDVGNKKVSIHSLSDMNYSEVLKNKIEDYLVKEFETVSMVIKVETLIGKCGGVDSIPKTDVFAYDAKRTRRIHEQRNSIVHTDEEIPGFDTIEEDLLYLQFMSFPFFIILMNTKYEFQLDPKYIQKEYDEKLKHGKD